MMYQRINPQFRVLPYITLFCALVLGFVVTACGNDDQTDTTPTGQVAGACDDKGQVTGQILVMTATNTDLRQVPAQLTLTSGDNPTRTLTTEADGSYTVSDLPLGEYEIEASVPGGVDGKTIQPRKKYFTVDDCYIETVSTVLLAEGITPPASPPAYQQTTVNYNNSPRYSLTSDPFFWLWLFDRPSQYGFGAPPYYTTTIYHQNHYIYVPTTPHYAPSNSQYHYTTYANTNTQRLGAGIKADPPVVSKGTTRIGKSGYTRPSASSSSSSSSSKGSTRPGSISSSSSSSSSKSGTSSKSGSSSKSKSGSSSRSSGGRRK